MALNPRSQSALKNAHPLFQKLIAEVVKAHPTLKFQVLESRRGKAAQEKAFALGHSRAHFGQSAHNWTPAIALDLTPLPLDWDNIKAFVALSKPILAKAKELKIPIEWGGDWSSIKDFPHYELSPWRDFAKHSKLYAG